jgi:hypothetical protein
MDPVSNVDRLVLLLRQRLAERSKAAAGRTSQSRPTDQPAASGLAGVQALAALESVDERQLKRALIQSLLADQFGSDLLNEAPFQQIVDRVTETLEDDADGADLLSRATRDLRRAAR